MKTKRSLAVNFAFALIFIALVILPLVRMFFFMDRETVKAVLTSASFKKGLINSLTVSTISTVISVVIAYLLAICIERSNIKCKSLFRVLLVLPMLVPSISHGMGLKILLGNNGIITNMLNISFSIYGAVGIVIGSVLYSFPVAFLMISDILKYEDYSPYEAAKILGLGKWHQFKAITFPYLRKPLISVVFAVFTMIITDYGVPLFIGGKYTTLPVIMFEEVIGGLDFAKGSVYGTVLLFPAVVAFLFDLFNKDKGNSGFTTREFAPSKSKLSSVLSYLWCSLISFTVLIPIISFFYIGFTEKYPIDKSFTFDNITKTLDLDAGSYLVNSIVIAIFVALLGVITSYITAYMTARMKSPSSRFLHLMAMLSAAIPGIVLGLSYIIVYQKSFVAGTLAILIMVNIVHFISSPYMMIYNTLCKLNGNLEGVGQSLGISRVRMIKDVIIPQTIPTILEMASYFFVNSMMTISAVSFLANTSTKPISLMINQFEAQLQLECAAIVSVVILVINLIMKLTVYLVKQTLSQQKGKMQNESDQKTV